MAFHIMTLVAAGVAAAPALPETVSFADQARLDTTFTPRAAATDRTRIALGAVQDDDAAAANVPFGVEGHRRITVNLAGTYDFKRDRSVDSLLGGVGWEFFLVDDFSLELQLNGFVIDQPPPEEHPVAANFAMLMRYYIVNEDAWALYVDGGIGLFYATDRVPGPGFGTRFNFTPQAGVGISLPIGDADRRLAFGTRWHHISNANTSEDNEGVDALQGYVSLSWAF